MPKFGVTVVYTELAQAYNAGYEDGYNKRQPNGDHPAYARAYITGFEDRIEDEQAVLLGEFDLLTPEEAQYLYGGEEVRSLYVGD